MDRLISVVAVLLTLAPPLALAAPWALTSDGPYQFQMGAGGIVPNLITDGTYKRDDYPWSGATLYMVTYRDQKNSYVADTNYHWTFSLTNPAGQTLGYGSYTYHVATNCFHEDSSGVAVACNVSIPDGQYGFWIFSLAAGTFTQCIPEKTTYAMASTIDGSTAGQWAFEPTIFHAAPPHLAALSDISPYLPARSAGKNLRIHLPEQQAESVDVTGTVYDKTGCWMPIPGAKLTIKNTVVPQSASHVHVTSEGQSGTGDYVDASSQWTSLDSTNSAIEMVTAQDGTFTATYEAGNVGVREKIATEVFDRDDTGSAKSEDFLDIRVPGLIALDTSETTYTIVGSYASTCDKGHNDGKRSATRRSHYVTLNTYKQIQRLNDLWLAEVGEADLCLNDASLEHGGFFDGGSNFTNKCHSSHRRGIDVDVNKVTSGCPENLNTQVSYKGLTLSKWEVLDRIARNKLNAFKAVEASIHYRFSH